MNIELLQKLCMTNGISGDEQDVAAFILNQIEGHYETCTADPLGNLLVFKRGRERASKKVAFSAHMDEVGLIVSHITAEGFLTFEKIGGIDDRVIFGRQVKVGKSLIPGVTGGRAIHHLSADERGTAVPADKMFIDIGCTSREEAEKLVQPGDPVYFASEFSRLGDRLVKGKAIDDRLGCAVMIEMIQSDLPYDCWFCFVTQEEAGMRGSAAAAYTVAPDYAVILETTAAGDMPGVSAPRDCCRLGKGAVVPFMDRTTIYPPALYRRCRSLADEKGIAVQTKSVIEGGNDAGTYHRSREGIRCLNLSAACRCLHSPCVLADIEDIEAVEKLAFALAETLPAE